MPLLQIRNLTHFFGGLRAVYNFRTEIEPGELRGLIGPNGAGKTTIFNLVTGIYKPTEGEIIFNGTNLVGLRPNQITALGIGRTFQNLRLWRYLTALDHVKIAFHSKIHYGLTGAFFRTKRCQEEEEEIEEKARELLRMMGIEQYADYVVTGLPYGIQRKVEMARALATEPKLLLLDEPTAGMSPAEMMETMEIIEKIRDELGLAIWLIEHRMKLVMTLCETIQVLDFGEIIAEGPPEEIKSNPRVIKAYLGEEVTV
ncbi:MAG: high-affinity branched-chain amino acid ABC transporter ATP-binding protein LivG [Chloroflexi bacterium]|nr:MAG: high-affinity branched-chain amino acid ABC transporter ATP-binding protein LivG [Chloroflexota bacterium]